MKAKDYAARYKAVPTKETLGTIAHDFMKDMFDLADARKVSTDAGWVGVINEIDQKWKAFARLCDDIQPDGFQAMLKYISPEMHDAWKMLNSNNGRPIARPVYQPNQVDIDKFWNKLFWG